jgi:hypothetical protein
MSYRPKPPAAQHLGSKTPAEFEEQGKIGKVA